MAEPAPERTPPDDTTEGLRERLAELFPCTCDEAYTSRGLTAPDCTWHRDVPEFLAVRDEELERLRAELAAVLDHDREAVRMLNAAEADLERLVALVAERDALKAAIAEQTQRTLNAAADKLYALPATDGAALKGPYWYRQGFTQAADLLRDWADYPAALAAPETREETDHHA